MGWMQCDWIQTDPVWADSACNVSYGGSFDMRRHNEIRSRRKKEEADVIAMIAAFLSIDKDRQ